MDRIEMHPDAKVRSDEGLESYKKWVYPFDVKFERLGAAVFDIPEAWLAFPFSSIFVCRFY
jgi:hypothetical protein